MSITSRSGIPASIPGAVAKIVADLSGEQVISCLLLGKRDDYFVLEVGTPRRTLIVKLAGPASSEPLFLPALAPHMLAAKVTKTPVSAILAADDAMAAVPFRYSVQTKMVGDTWFSRRQHLAEDQIEEALASLASVTAELHSARLDGYGKLTAAAVVIAEPLLAALHRHADRILPSSLLRDRFHEVLERRRSDFVASPPAGITHEDLHGFNILFSSHSPTSVSAVLDFDKAWIGPVESDIARMELWHGMTSTRSLAIYWDRIGRDDGYEARRPIYQLLWCYEFASPSPEHLALTNELEAPLGLDPLPTFQANPTEQ